MRILITIFILVSSKMVWAQARYSSRLSHGFTFGVSGLLGTGMSMNKAKLTDGSVSKNTMPGASATVEYSIMKNGFTGSLGIGLQILPAGVKYRLSKDLFNLPEATGDITGQIAEYAVILPYFPVKVGYTFKETKQWSPSLLIGVNLYRQNSYLISNTQYIGSGSDDVPIYKFIARSPHGGKTVWMPTYTATARIARVLPNNGRLFVGLLANFSNKTLYTGNFLAAYETGLQGVDYSDSGSFVGLQIRYSLPKK